MLITEANLPTPVVGQLLYKEYRKSSGELEMADLVFVDEAIEPGDSWMYTQVAHAEDFGEGMVVYLGIEAGGMPPSYTRLASDEDLRFFFDPDK